MKWTGFQRLTCLTGVTHHKTHASFQSSSCHAVMNLQGWLKDWPLGALWDWPRVSTCPVFFFFFFPRTLWGWTRCRDKDQEVSGWGWGWVSRAGGGPTHTWCAQKCPVSPFVFLCTFILSSAFSPLSFSPTNQTERYMFYFEEFADPHYIFWNL